MKNFGEQPAGKTDLSWSMEYYCGVRYFVCVDFWRHSKNSYEEYTYGKNKICKHLCTSNSEELRAGAGN